MDKEINAGYIITDRLTVKNAEFVIGQNENAPPTFIPPYLSCSTFFCLDCCTGFSSVLCFCSRPLK